MINEDKFGVYEPDSSLWTWHEFYNKTYRKIDYWNSLKAENKNGKYYEAKYNYKYGVITIGGDTVFHFTNGYGYLFRKILGELYDESRYVNMNHSVLNFSLLPKDGALNNNKANGKYCDRVDRFVYYVNEYIIKKNQDNPLLKIRGNNHNTIGKLKLYLDTINSIEEFCYNYYLIDNREFNLVDRLLISGKKYVNGVYTKEACLEYLSIAEDFWSYRKSLFEEEFGLDIALLDENG